MSLGRHTRPACHLGSPRDVLIKKVDVDLHRVCFSWLLGCEGSGTTFRGLRMRSRSTRKWAPRNAGDLGSRLAVCACAYDPIHVTAQGKRLGPNCACVQLPGSSLHKTMQTMQIQLLCVRVLYSYGVTWILCPYMGHSDVNKSHGRNARFWLVERKFAALWLVRTLM